MKDQALRLALEALEEPKDHIAKHRRLEAIAAIKQALEQPEPEPVAWTDMAYARLGMVRDKMHPDDVATVQRFLEGDYTPPPKREWQGLTDDEIDEGQRQSWVEKQAFESAVWWAEAKLKEKNT